MNINTKSELKGKKYKCLKVVKGYAIDDIPTMRKKIIEQVEAQGGKVEETETAWNFGNQFILKPKQKREEIGTLDCTKSYAMFNGIRIEYTDIQNVFASCFETSNAKYAIHALIA